MRLLAAAATAAAAATVMMTVKQLLAGGCDCCNVRKPFLDEKLVTCGLLAASGDWIVVWIQSSFILR